MDRDYIIAFDENGEPYIAHALGSRLSGAASNARRAGSRYLMKIQTKYGNRYFYTPQEVQAYQRAKSGVKKAADSAKSTVNSTKKHVNQTVKILKSDLKKRQTWKNAEKEARNTLKVAQETRKKMPLGDSVHQIIVGKTKAERAYDKAFAAATKKTYDKTKLGKAENAAKDKASSAIQSIKEQVKNLIPGAKVTGNKLVMPSGNEITIPEKFITEQIIPESFIEEQLIKEKKIEEKKSK